MPFKSEEQRRYLWAREPKIARDWTDTYGSRIHKNTGGITRLGFQNGNNVDPWWLEKLKEGREKIGNIWSGITGSKPGKAFHQYAFTPMMALANMRNPLNPNAQNYNPLLGGQRELALRSIDQGGLGFIQDDLGRFLGSTNPDDPNYNPLQGKNLVSLFGTNDLQEMLRKRLAYFKEKKYESETKAKKMAKIQEMINRAKVQDEATVKATPSLPAHYLERGGGGYQDAPIHSAAEAASRGIDVRSTGMMGPGGVHYSRGGIANLWQG